MPSQKVLYEDEIEFSVSKVLLRRRYLSPNQISVTPSSKQKYLTGTVKKPAAIKPIYAISWICIVVSGLAWLFYFGGMPWAPLLWLRTIPIIILAMSILGHYLNQKRRKNEESSNCQRAQS